MRLIDADELKTAFPYGEYIRTESVRATIDHMPTIEPERKKGKWIISRDNDQFYCSVCGELSDYKYRFCPDCGTDMRQGDTE